ncbi:MAG TPA: Pr6Pr family membrane protein [Gaiellaceae bacterium]|nr:Pr6Pr family membrane protein [Gaiellaceae bacterium]
MSPRDLALIVGRVGCAATGVVAMTYQFSALDHTLPTFSHGNFFSFFTIQSNILAAAVLVAGAIVRGDARTRLFDALRGAGTLYIAITGVVFALLLAGHQEDLDTHIAWVDAVVHEVIPVAVAGDWLLDPPRNRLPVRVAWAWLAYPVLWFVFTLVRGASVDWYPYPFVDVSTIGYGGVAWRSAVLAAAFAGAALAFCRLGNARVRASSATRHASIAVR